MKDTGTRAILKRYYRSLFRSFGPQHWWPGTTRFEVMVGAILTQNTSWANVERAIMNLKKGGPLTPGRLRRLGTRRLASLIRSAGYFNVKAKRLKSFLDYLFQCYGGSVRRFLAGETQRLRHELLGVHGIGPETADSILLYAGGRPVFVVDAYTKRVLSRHGLVDEGAGYDEIQRLFMENLPLDTALFNEYHALLVRVGKEFCRTGRPLCEECPLGRYIRAPLKK